jgi:hypothetical protein
MSMSHSYSQLSFKLSVDNSVLNLIPTDFDHFFHLIVLSILLSVNFHLIQLLPSILRQMIQDRVKMIYRSTLASLQLTFKRFSNKITTIEKQNNIYLTLTVLLSH